VQTSRSLTGSPTYSRQSKDRQIQSVAERNVAPKSSMLRPLQPLAFGSEEQTMNCEFGVAFSEREQSAASCRSVAGDVPLLSRAPNRFREDTTPCGFPSSAGRPKNIETRSFRLRRVDYFLIRHKVTMPCDEKSEFLPKTAKKFFEKGGEIRG